MATTTAADERREVLRERADAVRLVLRAAASVEERLASVPGLSASNIGLPSGTLRQ